MEPGAQPTRHSGPWPACDPAQKAKRSTDSVGGPSRKIEANHLLPTITGSFTAQFPPFHTLHAAQFLLAAIVYDDCPEHLRNGYGVPDIDRLVPEDADAGPDDGRGAAQPARRPAR